MSLDPRRQERLERLVVNQQVIIADLKTRNAQLEEELRRLRRETAAPRRLLDGLKRILKRLLRKE